jgi:AraC-like DNA-binding protein
VLSERTLLDRDGVQIADVTCHSRRGPGDDLEHAGHHAVVFVRRGCFVHSADGEERLLDPTRAFCINTGQEQRYDHPHGGGDDCTSIRLAPRLLASLWGGDPTLPPGALPSPPWLDLGHRLLLAEAHRGHDPDDLVERTILLTAATLEQVDPGRVAAARPVTVRARRAVVDAARAVLVSDPNRTLAELAGTLGVSPHHLSRLFHAATGHTISRHRTRLRVRAALERLAEGEHSLAGLATDLGFVDQSHLTRAVRDETGHTPAALRRALNRMPDSTSGA